MNTIKKILLILTFFLFLSCVSRDTIYKSTPTTADIDISGYNITDFFKKGRDVKKIRFKNQNLLRTEIKKIKDSIIKIKPLTRDNLKFGIYEYSFIVSGDTLYANSTLVAWRYKMHTGNFKNFNLEIKNLLEQY